MQPVSEFANRRPFVFGLLILLAWILLAGFITASVVQLFQLPLDNPFTHLAGTLSATVIVLFYTYRLGWLQEIGVTDFGTINTWGLTIILGFFVVLSGFYAYFGNLSFELNALYDTSDARVILLQTLLTGFVEESIFRGVLLYAFVRIWGKTKKGLVAGIVTQAALFGVLHALQAFYGVTPVAAAANVLATFIFGVWLGILVLLSGSLWPAILLHTASNAFLLIKGISSSWIEPAYLGYLREAIVGLPLVLIGLWVLLKAGAHRRFVLQMKSQVMSDD